MKASKKAKRAFKAWRKVSTATNVSLKTWAKDQVSKKTSHEDICFSWLGNKGVL